MLQARLRALDATALVVEFNGYKRGIPPVDLPETTVALLVDNVGLVIVLPDSVPKRNAAPKVKIKKAVEERDWSEYYWQKQARLAARPTYQEATAGLYGAAKNAGPRQTQA